MMMWEYLFFPVLELELRASCMLGSLPSPTIDTEPGPRDAEPALKIPRGSSITFVCSNPDGYDVFRLEKNEHSLMDKKNIQPPTREARFCFSPVNESIAGLFNCIYMKGSTWSPRSKTVEVKVISEDVTLSPAPRPSMTSGAPGPKTESIYILIVVSVVFLVCLLLLSIFCLYSHCKKKQGLPNSKSQQQRSQESLSTNGMERTPDIVTENRRSEDRRTETRTPFAKDLQEVTYAQLDHHSLSQRTVGAVTPQSRNIVAESSTYADIVRH
ncbi:leukocyte-associated immunoglobulin-like receptor 1 isoform X3 [Meriones unguiculatus]|uniref:leukocyte-associated immunoglobulin-like receptor 1 isoform X3 n=1 Tax=Meriones unguiculatus TaxID=10047 RepID=UPI00293F2B48|nr:leukocyte-associated immunoglobulin-like receptor 1 isoform X3 [Meriones unguiculatus]